MAKLLLSTRYVETHGKASRYRRIVPADVSDKIGRDRWIKTFPKDTPLSVIERTAKRLGLAHDREIAIARGNEVSAEQIAQLEEQARELITGNSPSDLLWYRSFIAQGEEDFGSLSPENAAMQNALEHDGRYIPNNLNLTAAHERDKGLYGGDRDEKPIEYAVRSFISTIGNKDITAIKRGDVSEWLASLVNGGLAPGTVKRRLGPLRALVNRAFLDFGYNQRNPFEKHPIKGGSGSSEDRLPFNTAMLQLIDSHLSANKRLGHETVNLIRLMRGTGTGPAEIGGISLSDLSLDAEIPYVWIRPNNIRRRLKSDTPARDRQIPLVGEALEAAQDAHRRALVRSKGKNPDDVAVFTSYGINGRGADSISAKLNKAIRAAGVPKSKRLTSYSYRHTLKEAMRSAGIADHVQDRLMGHSGNRNADRYGSSKGRLAETKDAIERALEYLGDVDPSNYSSKERI